MLGVEPGVDHFDQEIMININSVLMALNQMGVGLSPVLTIKDETDIWDDFLGPTTELEAVKTYVYLKVRLLFDPPYNSFAIDSIVKLAKEYEWRLNARAEGGQYYDE